MRKLLISGLLLFSIVSFSQNSTKPANILNTTSINEDVDWLFSSEEIPSGLWRRINKGSLTFTSSQITNFDSTVISVGNANYKLSSYTPSYAEVVAALGYTPFNPTGNGSQYVKGDGTYGSLPAAPVNADWNAVSGITQILNKPQTTTVTRPLNSTTFTISSTKEAIVRYNIKISCTASIGSNSLGRINFQYSTNGGSSWIDAGEIENSNTVTLAIALNSITTQSGFIVWKVPANALCRLVPTNTGTTTITWIRGQEEY